MASDPMDLTVIFSITSGSVCRLQHSVTAVAVMSLLPIASNTQHSTSSNMRRRASFISVTNQGAPFHASSHWTDGADLRRWAAVLLRCLQRVVCGVTGE